jgi:acyl-CoA synthetase (AMP-forming)/AMP-acid ligase II
VEIVAAVCIPRKGEDLTSEEVLVWRSENIAVYKAPRYVEVRSELPYGMTLKVLKRILRGELAEKIDVSNI